MVVKVVTIEQSCERERPKSVDLSFDCPSAAMVERRQSSIIKCVAYSVAIGWNCAFLATVRYLSCVVPCLAEHDRLEFPVTIRIQHEHADHNLTKTMAKHARRSSATTEQRVARAVSVVAATLGAVQYSEAFMGGSITHAVHVAQRWRAGAGSPTMMVAVKVYFRVFFIVFLPDSHLALFVVKSLFLLGKTSYP